MFHIVYYLPVLLKYFSCICFKTLIRIHIQLLKNHNHNVINQYFLCYFIMVFIRSLINLYKSKFCDIYNIFKVVYLVTQFWPFLSLKAVMIFDYITNFIYCLYGRPSHWASYLLVFYKALCWYCTSYLQYISFRGKFPGVSIFSILWAWYYCFL